MFLEQAEDFGQDRLTRSIVVHRAILRSVAEKEDTVKPEPPKAPTQDGNVITTTLEQLEGIVEKIVDKLLGDDDQSDDKVKPKDDSDAPKTDRETERTLRQQVADAVAELDRERSHEREHADLKAKADPKPPEAEVKSWKHSVWGDRG